VLTPDEVAKELQKVETYKKIMQDNGGSPFPQTLAISGPANDVYVPEDPSEARFLSGMPKVHQDRTVIIATRPVSTMQSGTRYAHQWQMTWKSPERWSNPLTGWTSCADPHSFMKLNFSNREAAIEFATKNGYKFEILTPQVTTDYVDPEGEKNYSQNFLSPRIVEELAADGIRSTEFKNPDYGKSNWFMPLTYHGDKEVEQFGPAHEKKSKK